VSPTPPGSFDRLEEIMADEPDSPQAIDSEAEIERLREVIRRLAEQDATLSVCDGNVTVTMDTTLTDAEREAIALVVRDYGDLGDDDEACEQIAATLRGLLERARHGSPDGCETGQ